MSESRPVILAADDNPADLLLVREALREAAFDADLVEARDGQEALDRLRAGARADLVLTDLQMPRLDGLALVEAVRREHSDLPVVLMTAFGSEAIAVESLRRGASSYVPKQEIGRVLARTLAQVLDVSRAARHDELLRRHLVESETIHLLPNDVALVGPLVQTLGSACRRMLDLDETEQFRLSIALHEALTNAIFHGNLELSSALRRDDEGSDVFHRLAEDRSARAPWSGRRVTVVTRLSRDEARVTVRDEGPGYDVALLPDPRDPARVETVGGRGLFLIRLFMDEVRHNERGNEITLIRRRQTPAPAEAV
ncbi:MAG TPA: response regulator [Candidatus Polarisedimenticolia bacterium]|nr:response regulator [Candidatus Polarisedimenticolia bacterium]